MFFFSVRTPTFNYEFMEVYAKDVFVNLAPPTRWANSLNCKLAFTFLAKEELPIISYSRSPMTSAVPT